MRYLSHQQCVIPPSKGLVVKDQVCNLRSLGWANMNVVHIYIIRTHYTCGKHGPTQMWGSHIWLLHACQFSIVNAMVLHELLPIQLLFPRIPFPLIFHAVLTFGSAREMSPYMSYYYISNVVCCHTGGNAPHVPEDTSGIMAVARGYGYNG